MEDNKIAKVNVFVTKTGKFRAKILEHKQTVSYEVTVGGREWKKGKGREFRKTIYLKITKLLHKLKEERSKEFEDIINQE